MHFRRLGIGAAAFGVAALVWIICSHRRAPVAPRAIAAVKSSPEGATKTPEPLTIDELRDSLERNDVCALASSDLEHRALSEDLFKLVSRERDVSNHPEESAESFHAYLSELGSSGRLGQRDEFGEKTHRALAVEFYTGLAYAGELANVALPEESESRSLAIFSKLMETEPENGAYPLFRALIRHDLGQADELVRKDLIRAAEAPKFQMYFEPDCLRTVEEGSRDEAHLYVALEIVSHRLPVPLLDGFKFVEDFFDNKDPDLERALRKLGSKIREGALARLERNQLIYCEVADLMISGILFDSLDRTSRDLASLSQNQTNDIRRLRGKDPIGLLISEGNAEAKQPGSCRREKLASAASLIRRTFRAL